MANKTMKNNWFDKHSQASKKLFDIANEVQFLAGGFLTTGNKIMYKILTDLEEELRGATKDIRDAITESITESCDRAAKSSKNVLKAALAGIILADKNK